MLQSAFASDMSSLPFAKSNSISPRRSDSGRLEFQRRSASQEYHSHEFTQLQGAVAARRLTRIIHAFVGRNEQTPTLPELRSLIDTDGNAQCAFALILRLRCSGSTATLLPAYSIAHIELPAVDCVDKRQHMLDRSLRQHAVAEVKNVSRTSSCPIQYLMRSSANGGRIGE